MPFLPLSTLPGRLPPCPPRLPVRQWGMSADPDTAEVVNDSIEIRCYFVRHRNALLTRGQFTPIYTDYYLHLMQHGLHVPAEADAFLKGGFAALTLHLASRPRNETVAWTLHRQNPQRNFFLTGSSVTGTLTGRVFLEGVKPHPADLFYAQTTSDQKPPRQSVVEFDEPTAFQAVESYYRQSEQRPARYFTYGDEDYAMLSAQPDCDLPWFFGLNDSDVRALDQTEELSLLETRLYRFECGCNLQRILPAVARLAGGTVEELFQDEEVLSVECPRCGAKYVLRREDLLG